MVWSATVWEKKRAAVSCALAAGLRVRVVLSSRDTHAKGAADQVMWIGISRLVGE